MTYLSLPLVIRYDQVNMHRTPCVVHTLQLVVLMVQKEATVKRLLDKARSNRLVPAWFQP